MSAFSAANALAFGPPAATSTVEYVRHEQGGVAELGGAHRRHAPALGIPERRADDPKRSGLSGMSSDASPAACEGSGAGSRSHTRHASCTALIAERRIRHSPVVRFGDVLAMCEARPNRCRRSIPGRLLLGVDHKIARDANGAVIEPSSDARSPS
jgi:hypothetical protein